MDVVGISGVPSDLVPLFITAGQTCSDVSPTLLAAQTKQESGFDANAQSTAGAEGLTQFLPNVFAKYGQGSIWNPADAIAAEASYDCALADAVRPLGGNTRALTLASYNSGINAVRKYHGIPPYRQTQGYVRSILAMAGAR